MSRIDGAKALVFTLSTLALTSFASGCSSNGTGPAQAYNLVADLQVTWSISGSTDPSQCDGFGIDQWLATVDGPESRQSTIDCRTNVWSSESDFFTITEGNYQVAVHALRAGVTVASQVVSYDLVDNGSVQPVHFEFIPTDFTP